MKPVSKVFIFASAEINPDFVSRLIMDFTKAKYSHAGVMVEFADGERVLYHAVDQGVCKTPYVPFMIEHTFPELIEITKFLVVSPDHLIGWLESKINLRYSFAQYPGVVFSFLATFALTRPFIVNGNTAYFCSEFAAETVEYACGIDLWEILDIVTPPQCIENLKKHIEGLKV